MALVSAIILMLCYVPLARVKCFLVTSPLKEYCGFYNYTTLDASDQVEAVAVIDHFSPLFTSNCSSHSSIFICSSYAPFCQKPKYRLLPCHELCFHVFSSCSHLFSANHLPWPSRLNCSKFRSPPKLCLSPSTLPPPYSSTPAMSSPSSPSAQPSLKTLFSVFSSSSTTTSTTTAAATTTTSTSSASPSHHLLLGLSLSFMVLVILFPVCCFYVHHHLCPRQPPPAPTQASIQFRPTVPLPSPPPPSSQSTRPPAICPPPPLLPRKSNVEYENVHTYSVIAD